MLKPQPKAILFDYDGVIADTSAENIKAWQWACEPFGVQVEPKDYYFNEGRKIIEISAVLLSTHGADPALAPQVVARREEYAQRQPPPRLFPPIINILTDLRTRGYRLALVSGASAKRLSHPALAELRTHLDRVVSGDDCNTGKPSPEPYLTGARLLEVAPNDCLVVENAPLGVASAKNAGMYCVGICSTVAAEHLVGADATLNSIDEFLGWLRTR